MSNNSRSSDDSPRDAAKLDGDERAGHSLIGERTAADRSKRKNREPQARDEPAPAESTEDVTRTTRQPRSGSGNSDNEADQRTPVENVPGNTSETGAGTPEVGVGGGTNTTRPRSPLGPGCMKTSGTMFIAAISMMGVALRFKR